MNDGSDMPHRPYTLLPGPGVYQPTPNPEFPLVVTPSFAGLAYMTPFVLRHHEQFGVEPGEIFDLAGAAYTQEYNEVKQLGDASIRGAHPESEESDIARFWPGGGSNWNLTTRMIGEGCCGLPTEAGASAEMLRQFFGTDHVPFVRSFLAPAVPLPAPLPPKLIAHGFETLSPAVAEAQSARVYAGIHFREGCRAGARQGTQIARFVAQHSLRANKRK